MKQYIAKKRFSVSQVVGLLALVFIGITVLAYATVNIPYTFTSGTTAKASEVNANFQALSAAMPAVKTTGLTYMHDIYITSSTPVSIANINVNAPAPGQIIVFASGIAGIKHTSSAETRLEMKLSDTANDLTHTEGLSIYVVSPTSTSGMTHLNIVKAFAVPAVGSYTYYLNAALKEYGANDTGIIDATLTALYVPNSL